MRWALVLVLAVTGCGDNLGTQPLGVLVFTRQTEWMHASNPVAAQALAEMGAANGWDVTVSDDPAVFTKSQLARTDVVVFSVTSGDVLDDAARANLEAYWKAGGGFVGIHSASWTEHEWTFYLTKVVPVQFQTHPHPVNVQPAHLTIEAPDDPIDAGLPDPWVRSDEYYTFQQRPEDIPGLEMLVALDESSLGSDYDVPKIGYHPLAFTSELSGGRSFYTALGHTAASYSEPAFMMMLEHGIEWAAAPHHMRR